MYCKVTQIDVGEISCIFNDMTVLKGVMHTPDRTMSPDSAVAPSLLSTYTTASLIKTSSNSLQSGRQAPTAVTKQHHNIYEKNNVVNNYDVKHQFTFLLYSCTAPREPTIKAAKLIWSSHFLFWKNISASIHVKVAMKTK